MRIGAFTIAVVTAALLPAVASAQSDLTAVEVTAPASVNEGQALRFRGRIANNGATTATFHWTAHLTVGGVLTGAPELGTFGPLTLVAGAEHTVDETVLLPVSATGRQRVAISVDSLDAVNETNEYDNVAVASHDTRILPRIANIAVRGVSVATRSGEPGTAITLNYLIVNGGVLAATFDLTGHLSDEIAPSPSDPEIARDRVMLAAGETREGQLAATIPANTAAGDYTIALIADASLEVTEPNETDNIAVASSTFNVFTDSVEIVSISIASGTVFIPYYQQVFARGGNGRYTFGLSSGALPTGLRIDPQTGIIAGTPLASGDFEVEVTAVSAGVSAVAGYTFTIFASGIDTTVTTPTLGRATVGLPYSAGLSAAGGEPPYEWSLSDGTLPPGLDLNVVGWMSGIPQQEGHFTFSVEVEDGAGNRDEAEFEVVVDSANVVILSNNLNPVLAGEAVDFPLVASGGKPPYRWRARSALPPGTAFSEDGHLTGAATRVGLFSFRVEVVDASRAGASDTALIHLHVREGERFEITSVAVPPSIIRQELVYQLTADGGAPPLTWRLAPGESLPQGFRLEEDPTSPARTARLVGSSIRALHHGFTVQVEDTTGRRRQHTLGIQVIFPRGAASSGCTTVGTADGLSLLLLAGLMLIVGRRRS